MSIFKVSNNKILDSYAKAQKYKEFIRDWHILQEK